MYICTAYPDKPVIKKSCYLRFDDEDLKQETIQYYLLWDPPLNNHEVDIDHYDVYSNSVLLEETIQRYAIIELQRDITTTIKVAAVDSCGQVSNYSSLSITPTFNTTGSVNNNNFAATPTPYPATTEFENNSSKNSLSILNATMISVLIILQLVLIAVMMIVVCICITKARSNRDKHDTSKNNQKTKYELQ